MKSNLKTKIIIATVCFVVALAGIVGGVFIGRAAKLNKAESLAGEGKYNEAFSIVSEMKKDEKSDAVYKLIVKNLKTQVSQNIDAKKFSEALDTAEVNKSFLTGEVYRALIADITKALEAEHFSLISSNNMDKAKQLTTDFKNLVFMTGITAKFTSETAKSGDSISKDHFTVEKTFSDGTTATLQDDEFEIVEDSDYIAGTTQTITIRENKYGYTYAVKVICPEEKYFDISDAKAFANSIKKSYPFKVSYIYDGDLVSQASFSDARGRYLYFVRFYYADKNPKKITSIDISNNMSYNKTENDYINSLFIKNTMPANSNEAVSWIHANLIRNGKYSVGDVKYTLYEGIPSYSYFQVYKSELTATIVQDTVKPAN